MTLSGLGPTHVRDRVSLFEPVPSLPRVITVALVEGDIGGGVAVFMEISSLASRRRGKLERKIPGQTVGRTGLLFCLLCCYKPQKQEKLYYGYFL